MNKGVGFASSNDIGPLTLYFIRQKSYPMRMLVFSFLVYTCVEIACGYIIAVRVCLEVVGNASPLLATVCTDIPFVHVGVWQLQLCRVLYT